MYMFFKKATFFTILILALFTSVFASSFSDVSKQHKNYNAILKLSEDKIVNGYDDGTFKPDNNLTRAEFCVIIARYNGYKKNSGKFEKELPFSDVSKEYWAEDYIKYAFDLGIINGMGDGTFLPAGSVTYEQAVKMIVCLLNIETKENADAFEKWYFKYLQAAEKNGILENISLDIADKATRADVVQMFYNILLNFTNDETEDDSEYDEDLIGDVDEAEDEDEDEIIVYKEIKTILIDPGHNYQGSDIGARTEDEKFKEEIITWEISEKLYKRLQNQGFEVWTTRKRKTTSIGNSSIIDSLETRAKMANELGVDLFISIHCNAGGGTGVETYCFKEESMGWTIAEIISKEISDATKLYDRGVKSSNYYVIKNTVMPSVLVETGFIDSEFDLKILTSKTGQDKIAQAIVDAIVEYNNVYEELNERQLKKGLTKADD